MTTTTDLAKFGHREIKIVSELLNAWIEQGLPEDFCNEEVVPMMNQNSGYVVLTNAECQVAMMNGDKLESWYTCHQCGHEGFKEDMRHNMDDELCREYLQDIGVVEGSEV